MGYTITIGELNVTTSPEDGLYSDCINFSANHEHDINAPAFGEPTDWTNSRWPSYTAWSEFMREAGIYDYFFYNGTLIGGHPGVRLVTDELREVVSKHLGAWRVLNPSGEAKFEGENADNVLCRLIWLEYWITKSLRTCKIPVIANS